jgi:hypothetical protein
LPKRRIQKPKKPRKQVKKGRGCDGHPSSSNTHALFLFVQFVVHIVFSSKMYSDYFWLF